VDGNYGNPARMILNDRFGDNISVRTILAMDTGIIFKYDIFVGGLCCHERLAAGNQESTNKSEEKGKIFFHGGGC
jgi:hypothetical protein